MYTFKRRFFDILDIISTKVDRKSEVRPANKKPTIIYVGKATPDLESHREMLVSELSKKGVEVIQESKDIYRSDIDHESLIDVLEYADMIIQLIGGKSGLPVGTSKTTEVEREFQVITEFISGKTKRILGNDKMHSWVIWMPAKMWTCRFYVTMPWHCEATACGVSHRWAFVGWRPAWWLLRSWETPGHVRSSAGDCVPWPISKASMIWLRRGSGTA